MVNLTGTGGGIGRGSRRLVCAASVRIADGDVRRRCRFGSGPDSKKHLEEGRGVSRKICRIKSSCFMEVFLNCSGSVV